MKKAKGAPAGNTNAAKQMGQIGTFVSTAEVLAAQHGVAERTVKRAGKLAAEIDATPALKDRPAK